VFIVIQNVNIPYLKKKSFFSGDLYMKIVDLFNNINRKKKKGEILNEKKKKIFKNAYVLNNK